MNFRNIFFSGVALAGLALGWILLHPSEESRVIATFERAADAVAQKGGESPLIQMARARKVSDVIAGAISVRADQYRMSYRMAAEEAPRYLLALWSSGATFSVDFENLEVAFPEARTAKVTGEALLTGSGDWFSGRDVSEFEAELLKDPEDGNWRFRAFKLKPVVTR